MTLVESLIQFLSNLDFLTIIIIIIVIMAIGGIVFRKFIFMIFLDYVIDFGLSFSDNFIGVGAVGLDIGDWVAALIIFISLRKITGIPIALLVAWEATNFFPVSLIPVIGEVVEVVTNFLPSASIALMLFNKFGEAKREKNILEENISAGKMLGLTTKKQEKMAKKVQELLDKENPVEALEEAKKDNKLVAENVMNAINDILRQTNQLIDQVVKYSGNAPPELIDKLQNGVNISQDSLNLAIAYANQNNMKKAVNAASIAYNKANETLQLLNQSLQYQTK